MNQLNYSSFGLLWFGWINQISNIGMFEIFLHLILQSFISFLYSFFVFFCCFLLILASPEYFLRSILFLDESPHRISLLNKRHKECSGFSEHIERLIVGLFESILSLLLDKVHNNFVMCWLIRLIYVRLPK